MRLGRRKEEAEHCVGTDPTTGEGPILYYCRYILHGSKRSRGRIEFRVSITVIVVVINRIVCAVLCYWCVILLVFWFRRLCL